MQEEGSESASDSQDGGLLADRKTPTLESTHLAPEQAQVTFEVGPENSEVAPGGNFLRNA